MGERDTSANDRRRKITWGQAGSLTCNDPSGAVTMQTGDLSDTEYRYYTLQFGFSGDDAQATAICSFMVNGIPTVRTVTVGQGVQLSGPADAISVRIVDSTPAAWNEAGNKYSVSVVCAPGTRAGGVMPILNDAGGTNGTGVYNVPGNGSTQIKVPSNVGVNGFWFGFDVSAPPAGTAGTTQISQLSGSGTLCWEQVVAANSPVWIPLMPGISLIQVDDIDGSGTTASIAWTIDG